MRCGLLGRKLGHSYSPAIHSQLADYSYDLFEKEPEELAVFLRSGNFKGLNVTIPYKKDVAALCDELSARAKKLGAVNTVVKRSDGKLIGHNTDYFGFSSLVLHSGLNVANKKVLVLGSGGSSVTAVCVLQELGADVIVISRSGENNYHNLFTHSDAAVIVNTTPVGMYPNVGISPVDLSLFPKLEGVLDIIYNPARTQILLDAEARGLVAVNGLWMLVAQAKESAEWFTGQKIDDSVILQIYNGLRKKMENTILIGMPGCGKSTIGNILAQRLGKQFIDADVLIEQAAGKSIPDIFAEVGEDGFRALESSVLKNIGKESGLVIATGGGCVTRPENYNALHQNGHIIWIQREISTLPTAGRPLSNIDTISHMYEIRQPLYKGFADIELQNNATVEAAVDRILAVEDAI